MDEESGESKRGRSDRRRYNRVNNKENRYEVNEETQNWFQR